MPTVPCPTRPVDQTHQFLAEGDAALTSYSSVSVLEVEAPSPPSTASRPAQLPGLAVKLKPVVMLLHHLLCSEEHSQGDDIWLVLKITSAGPWQQPHLDTAVICCLWEGCRYFRLSCVGGGGGQRPVKPPWCNW